MRKSLPVRPALLCLVACLTGCAGTGLFHTSEFPKASLKDPVARIVGLWQPEEGMFKGQATRGFSGQILFFTKSAHAPAQVDGEVMIYVFDDQGSDEEQIKPIMQHRYESKTWNAFLAKGPI